MIGVMQRTVEIVLGDRLLGKKTLLRLCVWLLHGAMDVFNVLSF